MSVMLSTADVYHSNKVFTNLFKIFQILRVKLLIAFDEFFIVKDTITILIKLLENAGNNVKFSF